MIADGKCVWSAELDIYGRVGEHTGDVDFIPFRYQGQYADAETGLYYNRFRYYDPSIGQYTQPDPIGLAGNNPTLYGYVHNPNAWIDVFGLKCAFRDEKAQKQTEEIIQRHGGVKVGENSYQFPNQRAAQQAASEIAGNLGSQPTSIPRGEYIGGPSSWENSTLKIGIENKAGSAGWRNDFLGHTFSDGTTIPPHFNVWNDLMGVFKNLHLLH